MKYVAATIKYDNFTETINMTLEDDEVINKKTIKRRIKEPKSVRVLSFKIDD